MLPSSMHLHVSRKCGQCNLSGQTVSVSQFNRDAGQSLHHKKLHSSCHYCRLLVWLRLRSLIAKMHGAIGGTGQQVGKSAD